MGRDVSTLSNALPYPCLNIILINGIIMDNALEEEKMLGKNNEIMKNRKAIKTALA